MSQLLALGAAGLALASAGVSAAGSEAKIALPLEVQPLPGHLEGFSRWFSKYVPVIEQSFVGSYGVQVVASADTPDEKVRRVANVLAQFLDNDEDGQLDNTEVVGQMERRGATMIMFNTFKELEESDFDQVDGYDVQDVEGKETSRPPHHARLLIAEEHGPKYCELNASLICDAPLEEVFHLVTDAGFAYAYPSAFGTEPGSALAVTMDHTIGDCGFASKDTPLGEYSQMRWPNCTGVYHYDDETCEYECLIAEYIHHFIASYNGEYPYKACPVKPQEWELCISGDLSASRERLRLGAPEAWNLILDPYYRIPKRFPTGSYDPPRVQATHVSAVHQRTTVPLDHFRIGLPDGVRRAHRRAKGFVGAAVQSQSKSQQVEEVVV